MLIIIALLVPLFLVTNHMVSAYDPFADTCDGVPTTGADSSTVCAERTKNTNPLTGTSGLLVRAAQFVGLLTGIASILIMIYAGLKYVTSDGDTNTISQAKSTVTYAFVGLIVSLIAEGILVFIINSVK